MMRHVETTHDPDIWIGNREDAVDFSLLRSTGVRVILNVCNDINPEICNNFVYLKWGLDDPKEGLAPRNDVMGAVTLLQYGVKLANRLGGSILVHCAAGHNRSALVVAVYLYMYRDYNFEKAIRLAGVKDQKNWMIDKGYTW